MVLEKRGLEQGVFKASFSFGSPLAFYFVFPFFFPFPTPHAPHYLLRHALHRAYASLHSCSTRSSTTQRYGLRMGTTKLALRALVEETSPQLLHGMGDSMSIRVCRPITYAACLIPDHMLAASFISSIDGDSFTKESSSAGASPFPTERVYHNNLCW